MANGLSNGYGLSVVLSSAVVGARLRELAGDGDRKFPMSCNKLEPTHTNSERRS